MKKMKKALALLLAVMTVFSLAACGAKKDDAAADTTSDPAGDTAQEETSSTPNVDAIKKAGVLVVGTSADYPPYEFHTEIDGKDTIVGFDIAIAQYFADQMGVELKVVDMSFNSLLISLAKGDFDLVMAGMTPNEERKKAVDFTDVFYRNKQIVLIRTEDADKFQTMEDLVGHKGAVQTPMTPSARRIPWVWSNSRTRSWSSRAARWIWYSPTALWLPAMWRRTRI